MSRIFILLNATDVRKSIKDIYWGKIFSEITVLTLPKHHKPAICICSENANSNLSSICKVLIFKLASVSLLRSTSFFCRIAQDDSGMKAVRTWELRPSGFESRLGQIFALDIFFSFSICYLVFRKMTSWFNWRGVCFLC